MHVVFDSFAIIVFSCGLFVYTVRPFFIGMSLKSWFDRVNEQVNIGARNIRYLAYTVYI